jgi:hypothetical protein
MISSAGTVAFLDQPVNENSRRNASVRAYSKCRKLCPFEQVVWGSEERGVPRDAGFFRQKIVPPRPPAKNSIFGRQDCLAPHGSFHCIGLSCLNQSDIVFDNCYNCSRQCPPFKASACHLRAVTARKKYGKETLTLNRVIPSLVSIELSSLGVYEALTDSMNPPPKGKQ